MNTTNTKVIQVLGAPRLSKDADESTSIERQKAGMDGWATYRASATGDTYRVIYPEVIDTDISGAVPPFERPGLGPYLRKPLLDTWSVLVVYRLDRLTRSIADFETLWKHLEAEHKTLVSVAENIDFGTPTGRLMARQLVLFAEYEREMIRARVKSAYDSAQAQGKYPGMMFPFGYMPVKLEPKGWGLEPHPVYSLTVSEIARRLLSGESLSSICRWLDSEGIPTPRNMVREYGNAKRIKEGKKPIPLKDAHWNTTSISAILSSPAVIGEVTVNTENRKVRSVALTDKTGMAIKRAEPLLDRQTWDAVKALLAANAAKQGPMVNNAALLGIARCAKCGRSLNLTNASWNGKTYKYYRCPNERLKVIDKEGHRVCTARRIPAAELEAYFELALMSRVGSLHITEEVEVEGIDYSTEMAELAEAIGVLTSKIELAGVVGQDVSKLEAQREVHRANLRRLAGEPTKAPETFERELDETWAERWRKIDWPERSALLRRRGITLKAWRGEDGKIRGTIDTGTLESKRRFMAPEPVKRP
jgi:DNA invertase Pin-like site-specific DNA recombinase